MVLIKRSFSPIHLHIIMHELIMTVMILLWLIESPCKWFLLILIELIESYYYHDWIVVIVGVLVNYDLWSFMDKLWDFV